MHSLYAGYTMDPESSQVTEQGGSGNSNKTVVLTLSICTIFFIVLVGTIFLFAKKKQTKPANYTNPFTSQTQKTATQNPFVQPTATVQNPFVQSQSQTANKPYQNPFGGGQ